MTIRPTLSRPGHRARTYAWLAAFTYLILIGGTETGELLGVSRGINMILASAVIIAWFFAIVRDNDLTDRLALLGVVLFLVTCLTSQLPRQSFEPAVQATALAATYYFARRHFADITHRELLLLCLGGICTVLAVVIGLLWILVWVRWLQTSGWALWPPISINLPTAIFSHRHEAGLMVAVLFPALMTSPFRRLRYLPTLIATPFVVLVILLDGSRSVMLAIGAATTVMLVTNFRIRRLLRRRTLVIALSALAIVTLIVIATPLGTALWLRLSNTLTLATRGSLWADGLSVWLHHPIFGLGPGTFPFAYLQTDHFQFSSWDPRNPDNGLIQLVAEMGLVGMAAAGSVLVGAFAGLRRAAAPHPAIFALIVFGVASVGMNPFDFLYLLVVALAWLSLATPARRRDAEWQEGGLIKVTRPIAAGALVVGVVLAGTAGIAYDIARGLSGVTNETRSAEAWLRTAAALDPTMAVYVREQASLTLAKGDPQAAIRGYEKSLSLAPNDPVALRGLTVARSSVGDPRASMSARELVHEQWFSTRNQLLLATAPGAEGTEEASDAFATAALLGIRTTFADSWSSAVTGRARRELLQEAVRTGLADTQASLGYRVVTVALLSGDNRLLQEAARGAAPQLARSSSALAELAACNPDAAWRQIVAAHDHESSQQAYWDARAVIAAAANRESSQASALAAQYRGWVSTSDSGWLAPGFGDAYRFRRLPFSTEVKIPDDLEKFFETKAPEQLARELLGLWCV